MQESWETVVLRGYFHASMVFSHLLLLLGCVCGSTTELIYINTAQYAALTYFVIGCSPLQTFDIFTQIPFSPQILIVPPAPPLSTGSMICVETLLLLTNGHHHHQTISLTLALILLLTLRAIVRNISVHITLTNTHSVTMSATTNTNTTGKNKNNEKEVRESFILGHVKQNKTTSL